MDQQPPQTNSTEDNITPLPTSTEHTPPTINKQFSSNQSYSSQPPKQKKHFIPFLLLFLLLAFFSGLGIATMYFQNKIQELKSTKQTETTVETKTELIIGTDPTAPSMEFFDKNGNLVGYDVDLGYHLAAEMGMKAKFVPTKWEPIFQNLLDKKIDIIISSVTITDERKQKYLFSEPYINAGQVVVSRKDNQITSVEKLRGKRISVQKGTTNEREALKYTDKTLVISYDDITDAAKAVSVASSDAMLADLTFAKGFIEQFDNLKITSDPFTNEYYGVVMRPDDASLQKKVNEALSVLQISGYLTDLKQKWLE